MNDNLNFFDILSAGDKELVHSSMIKLLLENELTQKEFLKLFSIEKKIEKLKIEKEKKIDKSNRYDLYINKLSGDVEYVIENKFKAVPSFPQIDNYKQKDRKLRLIVFSADFISGCNEIENDDFKIISYLTFQSQNNSIFSLLNLFLEKYKSVQIDDGNIDFLILVRHYRDFLAGFSQKLYPFITSDKCCFNEILNNNDVFILRNYLFHLQGEIIKTIDSTQNDLLSFWTPINDGGSNTNPCVSFFGPDVSTRFFLEFQGASLKAGLLFDVESSNKDSKKTIEDIKKNMIQVIRKQEHNFEVLFKDVGISEHLVLRKIKENKLKSSSMAFKFDLSDKQFNKQSLVRDVVKIMGFLKISVEAK